MLLSSAVMKPFPKLFAIWPKIALNNHLANIVFHRQTESHLEKCRCNYRKGLRATPIKNDFTYIIIVHCTSVASQTQTANTS